MTQHRNFSILKNNYGYSLVELMIVVAIVGILGSYAKFNYSPANARLKQAARELYSSMQSIRMEAIKRNENWAIICDEITDTYTICAYNANACTGTNTTITLNDYGSNIQFGYGNADNSTTGGLCPAECTDKITYTTPDDIAYFDPKGLSPSKGYIYLQNNKGSTFAIGTTSLAGVVKIRRWSGKKWE